jgi:glycerol-1-phosphate dehydrogenase [NAD(P)+]
MTTPIPALASFDDIRTLLATADPGQDLAPCGIRRIHRGSGAIGSVADSVADVLGSEPTDSDGPPRVTMIRRREADPAGRATTSRALVENQLRERYAVHREVLDDGYPELHVSEEVVEAAARAAAGADAVVAVGGGTISDIGKLATDRPPRGHSSLCRPRPRWTGTPTTSR